MKGLFPCVLSFLLAIACATSSSRFLVKHNDVEKQLALIAERRMADLARAPDSSSFDKIGQWLGTQNYDGTWDDVNYLAGCKARRANWPAQEHWDRLITFAAAWSGANPSIGHKWARSDALLTAIYKGLMYWFDNDYMPDDCMVNGGEAKGNCPCSTSGLWNTASQFYRKFNWYDQVILIPQLCSTTCLLLKDAELPPKIAEGCQRIPRRAYDLMGGKYGTGAYMTGSNAVLVMQNSICLALYTNNATLLRDAFSRAMRTMTFSDRTMEDGIHRDGSFLQHSGLLYNGNYGKDMLNTFIQLEGEAAETSFAADDITRQAMATLIRGSEWMIYTDSETKQQRWDFNVLGRFIAFPTADLQANADINFNVSKLRASTRDFQGQNDLHEVIRRLDSNGTQKLVGNKGFWASDYMVHRRSRFTLCVKMLSTRSSNSEHVNGANPYGLHLGQGTLFTYVRGNEYKDIVAGWDWNLIPGITTLRKRLVNKPPVVKHVGKKDFVGVASDGVYGTAVQDYVDPVDGSISFRKAWYFYDDCVLITTTNLQRAPSRKKPPLITVLDNRAKAPGKVLLDSVIINIGGHVSLKGHSLYYGGNEYVSCGDPFHLTLREGYRVGDWSDISSSKRDGTTISIFSAYTTLHNESASYSYLLFPATDPTLVHRPGMRTAVSPITENGITGAAGAERLTLVFWPDSAKEIAVSLAKIGWAESGHIIFTSNQPGVYMLASQRLPGHVNRRFVVTLSDPTQKLTSAKFSLEFRTDAFPPPYEGPSSGTMEFDIELPLGGMAGSSVSKEVFVKWTRWA
ncbi:hypothetical protein HIM_02067 [Hirsutella minnesotensis 3608]|nr:hypothetical protein HIM_02067 [Hirsutella minnesotensis 3608]